MATYLSAPNPSNHITVILPSPEFNDSKASESRVNIMRSMDGAETYTYVKSSERQVITLPFLLSRAKAIELKEFVRIYYRAEMSISLPDGTVWIGALVTNPFSGSQTNRSTVEVTLSFSAVQRAE